MGSVAMNGALPFETLIERQIWQESRGNPNAVSPAGAAGIMQIMPATAADPGYGVRPLAWADVFDASKNRAFGEEYMRALLTEYSGDQRRALVAYNWGPGNANKWDGNVNNLPAETRNYVANILGGTNPPTTNFPAAVREASPAPIAPEPEPTPFAAFAAAPPSLPRTSRPEIKQAFAEILQTEAENQARARAAAEVAGASLQHLAILPMRG